MMEEFGRHAGYIAASYAAAFVILAALVAQTVAAYRGAKARLDASGEDRG
jgi:heme exporter protein CcmD